MFIKFSLNRVATKVHPNLCTNFPNKTHSFVKDFPYILITESHKCTHTHTYNFITNTKLLFISRLSLQNYLNRTTTRDFRTNFIRTIEWLLHIYHSYIILICFHFMASTSHRMCIDVYLKLFGAAGSLLSIGPFHFFMGFYAVSFHFQFCTFNFLLPTSLLSYTEVKIGLKSRFA